MLEDLVSSSVTDLSPSIKLVESVLEDLVSNAVTDPRNTTSFRYPYPEFNEFEREHYARIAQWKAEFYALCPTFDADIRALKVVKERRRPRKEKEPMQAVRKSIRVSTRTLCEITHTDTCNADGDTARSTHEEECDASAHTEDDAEEFVNELDQQSGLDETVRFACLPCGKSFR